MKRASKKAATDRNLRQSTDLLAAPGRCVHIGDRESDIYELFCLAEEVGTHFLVRTCVDRLAGDGNHTIADEMDEVTIKGLHRIKVKDDKGDPDDAVLEIRYRKISSSRFPADWTSCAHSNPMTGCSATRRLRPAPSYRSQPFPG
ncbi:hypothetical protein ACVIYL_001087 [Bradyrhizobium sp. USDA 3315]